MAVITCEANIEFIHGAPASTVEGDPNCFYIDLDSVPKGGDWGDATTWYRWDVVSESYVIGGGPKPKPHH